MKRQPEKVFIVFKTHFDIGYTHLAKELLEWYGDGMIKDVVEVCKATREAPKGKKYVWTVPSWPLTKTVEHIKEPELKQTVETLIEEGQLIWHSLPFTTHTEFCGMEEFLRGLYVARKLSNKYGRSSFDAKMTDVPGHTWILPSILAKAGIKFIHLGSNFCATPPEVPRLFFWEGPDGSRVLTYYSKGEYGTDLLPPEEWDYPYWLAMLQTLDNLGAQDTTFLDQMFDRAAKEMPGTEVSIGSLEDFATAMLAGDFDIPVIKGDLADTWIRGVGSAPKGVSKVREQRPLLCVLESAAAFNKLHGLNTTEAQQKNEEIIAQSYEKMLLFGEHTWSMDTKVTILPERYYGAPWVGFKFWESGIFDKDLFNKLKCSDPGYLKLQESWEEQMDYLRDADKGIALLEKGALKNIAASVDLEGDKITVVSNLGWKTKTDILLDSINFEAEYLEDAQTGEKTKVYTNHEGKKTAEIELPALGYRTFKVLKQEGTESSCSKIEAIAYMKNAIGVLDNQFFRIEVDPSTGCIKSLYHKTLNKQWVNSRSDYGFGQYLYDIWSSKELDKFVVDYSYVLRDWGINDTGKAGYPKDQKHFKFVPKKFDVNVENGCNWGKIIATAEVNDDSIKNFGNAAKVKMIITAYAEHDYMDIKYDLLGKVETPLIESGHFAFPLSLVSPQYTINKLGSVLDPEKDILPGCNKDLHCCEKWVDISDGNHGIALIPLDNPLLSFDEPGFLKFNKEHSIKEPTVLFQGFNNSWGTNFPQWIGGDLSFRYRLVPHKGTWQYGEVWKQAEEAMKRPIISFASEAEGIKRLAPAFDLLADSLEGFNILAFKSSEDDNCYILRIIEASGIARRSKIKFHELIKEVWACDLLERNQVSLKGTKESGHKAIELDTEAFEIHTIKLAI